MEVVVQHNPVVEAVRHNLGVEVAHMLPEVGVVHTLQAVHKHQVDAVRKHLAVVGPVHMLPGVEAAHHILQEGELVHHTPVVN